RPVEVVWAAVVATDVAWPLLFSATPVAPICVPPLGQPVVALAAVARPGPHSQNVTVPVGVPPPALTVTVSVASWPGVVGPVGVEVVEIVGTISMVPAWIWLSWLPGFPSKLSILK